jgi:hypothetical protein
MPSQTSWLRLSALTSRDQVPTPSLLAGALVRAARTRDPEIVADFAVGDGILLEAALSIWPGARALGLDVDTKAIAALRERQPDWHLVAADFWEVDSLIQCFPSGPATEEVSLALLNPPFCCKGGTRRVVSFRGLSVTCSPALAYAMRALLFLRPQGELLAILPLSVLTSQRDRRAWSLVQELYDVEMVCINSHSDFRGATVRTFVARFGCRAPTSAPRLPATGAPVAEAQVPWEIASRLHRGSLSVPAASLRISSTGPRFLHTTNLQQGRLVAPVVRVSSWLRLLEGPAVLVPRVGQPRADKVVVVELAEPTALSDCVIGIKCDSIGQAEGLAKSISGSWTAFAALYSGSCARFLTLERLTQFIYREHFLGDKSRKQ